MSAPTRPGDGDSGGCTVTRGGFGGARGLAERAGRPCCEVILRAATDEGSRGLTGGGTGAVDVDAGAVDDVVAVDAGVAGVAGACAGAGAAGGSAGRTPGAGGRSVFRAGDIERDGTLCDGDGVGGGTGAEPGLATGAEIGTGAGSFLPMFSNRDRSEDTDFYRRKHGPG